MIEKSIVVKLILGIFLVVSCTKKHEVVSITLDNFECKAGDCFDDDQGHFSSDIEICFKEPFGWDTPYLKLDYHLKNGTVYSYEDNFGVYPKDKEAICVTSSTRLQFLRGRNIKDKNWKIVRELYKENIDHIHVEVYSEYQGELLSEYDEHFKFEGDSYEELHDLYRSQNK